MKNKILKFKKCCEVVCFTLIGLAILMLFGLPEYITWLPEVLIPVAEKAEITSGSVMVVLVPGILFGAMAFGCDVLMPCGQTRKEAEDGRTI